MSQTHRDSGRTFQGIPQAMANGRGSQGLHFSRGNKLGYMEVEILDSQMGRSPYVIDKVHPSATVLDLKIRFHKTCPARHPSRTGLRLTPNGAFLRDNCELRTIASSSLLSVHFTDLGRQVGWITVFLSQYVGPLFIYLLFYFRLAGVYDNSIRPHYHQVVHLACFCHSLHYIKHLLETLFVHTFSDGYTPLGNLLKGCAFHWGFTTWLGYYVNHPLYTPPYYKNKQVIPSLVWFLLCEFGNLCINISLARHKPTGNGVSFPGPTYNPFTWLYKLVHCPQYTYMMGAWLSLSVMTQTVPVGVFAALISVQMLLWARRKHTKYLRQVNSRSFWRTAVIPFLI
ncbi:trans-2,3-enoyl-CoA reductase-like isoform X3 [Esox lucius]|uniref:trans-2,3-enoyl-CoA reductase-like isoform X3 n=1 Tax=Esox lucius TaxID=8010 RepID=UPI000973369D|nr:trans-2,3-enoyl-CoA reductase-like isoform X3 [Esox lucius]